MVARLATLPRLNPCMVPNVLTLCDIKSAYTV